MVKIAVILSGCGHKDGAEIRESVLTLLSLEQRNVVYKVFAPNIMQSNVINHITGDKMAEERNVLIEAARIARGDIQDLLQLNVTEFDALIMPGGFGALVNFSDIANGGNIVIAPVKRVIREFYNAGKPIGAVCIAPACVAASLADLVQANYTLGKRNELLDRFGAMQEECAVDEIAIDAQHKIVCAPAYMLPDTLPRIYVGIDKLVKAVVELC